MLDSALVRNIKLSSKLSVLLSLVSILFSGFYLFFNNYRIDLLFFYIILSSVLFLVPYVLNKIYWINLSRVILSILPPVLAVVAAIYSKTQSVDTPQISAYYDYRFIILVFSIFPFVLFELKEWRWLVPTLIVSFLCLILFDPLHEYYDIGFTEAGHYDPSYTFSTVVTIFCYFLATGGIIVLKYTIDNYTKINNNLIEDLKSKNTEIEAQNNQILKRESKLSEALKTISEQKNLIQSLNADLEEELLHKNVLLEKTNKELIQHNSELKQFSFTVSHNLRGPVATLLGILHLMDIKDGDQDDLMERMKKAIFNLDEVIKDLNKIVSIRDEILKIREKIVLSEELEKILIMLKPEIDKYNVIINQDFSAAPHMYSVKAMINSILYNLISNAIKFHTEERQPVIEIKSFLTNGYLSVNVTDNGIGMDVENKGENIFNLYQRYNTTTEGKGLGLYLVKTQTELLDGKVEVQSAPGKGASFTVKFKVHVNIQEQVYFEDNVAKTYYNAERNLSAIIWKKQPSFEEYKKVYIKALEQMLEFSTPIWFVDYRLKGDIPPEFHQWMRKQILPIGFENGLKKLVCLMPEDTSDTIKDYMRKAQDTFDSKGIKIQFAYSVKDADQYLDD